MDQFFWECELWFSTLSSCSSCQYRKHFLLSIHQPYIWTNFTEQTWMEQTFLFTARSSSSSSICTWVLRAPLPPEIQPERQCHSDKWIVTGQAYQCQRQAALRDFDSALFPQLNRRLCFAKQTNKQRTWRVWWKSKQHGPVTCPTTMTLPK